MVLILIVVFFLFCFFPLLSLPVELGMMVIDRRRAVVYLVLICIAISIPAIYFVPQPNDDAYRIFKMMDQFPATSFTSLYEYYQSIGAAYTTYPLFIYVSLLVKRTNEYNLLSFICTFGTYFFFLLPITGEYAKRKVNFESYFLISLMIALWNNYHYTISGMRFQLATAIIFSVFFYETRYLKGFLKYSLYLIPMLIHPGVLPLILIRVLYKFLEHSSTIKQIMFVIISLFFWGVLPNLGTSNQGVGYLVGLISKAAYYMSNDAFGKLSAQTIFRVVISVIAGILILWSTKYLSKTNLEEKKYEIVSEYYIITTLILSLSVNLANRFELLLIPIGAMLLVRARAQISQKYLIDLFSITMIIYGFFYNFNINNSPFAFPRDLLLKNIFSIIGGH